MAVQYSDSIAKTLLFDPVLSGADRLCILASTATPSMVSWLLTTYEEQKISNITIELIVESVLNNGIDNTSHEGFKELHDGQKFSCSYLCQEPDSKMNLYIWLQGETPIVAFNCSYDFTQASLLRSHSGFIADHSAIYAYKTYEDAVDHSIFCNHSEVEDYIIVRSSEIISKSDVPVDSKNYVHLSLLTKEGETGKRSGLNWGQRGKRNRNEAYIRLPRKIAKTEFFPLNKQHFLVVTDDHHTLQLRVEQQGDKAITTPASNALLGEYFRNRLGLSNGAYVNTSDLQTYGRTDVEFYKIDDEQYYMDFSPPTIKK